ncbi:MAG: recombination mediator RecR [Phycisphaerales bacterium]|nr:recombination mediator RecR [Phycisphaerales bacterium]
MASRDGLHAFPEPVDRLVREFERLPGIGRRTATRLAFHVLKDTEDNARALATAIEDVKTHVSCCGICFQLTDIEPCRICADPSRDASTILVVEQPGDLMTLEGAGMFRGVYHVLAGRIDPLSGVGPEDLTVPSLLERIDTPERNAQGVAVKEVILGLNPNLEGDSTTLYLGDELARREVKVTRLARGLPSGSQLEFANNAVLADAIHGRQGF